MVRHDYTCRECGLRGEYSHGMNEEPTNCMYCHAEDSLTKILSVPSVHTGSKTGGNGRTRIIVQDLACGHKRVTRETEDTFAFAIGDFNGNHGGIMRIPEGRGLEAEKSLAEDQIYDALRNS